MNTQTPSDYLFRVGDGENFWNSSHLYTWGIEGLNGTGHLPSSPSPPIKKGDRMWFIKGRSNGKIVAVATFNSMNLRGEDTLTNEELGWTDPDPRRTWSHEIHYKNLYDVSRLDLLTNIKNCNSVSMPTNNCQVDLPHEYPLIDRYSSAVNHSGGGGVGWRVVM